MAHFTDGTNDFTADKSLTENTTPNTFIQTFGDGYEQRLRRGINSLGKSYTVTFINRTKAEANNIISFFESKGAVDSFVFAPPHLGSKTNQTSFSGKVISSTGFNASLLAPTNPSHILVTGSSGNDGGYTLDATGTINNTTLTVTETLSTETNTASVTISAGIKVVCSEWQRTYDYDDYYSVSGTFRRVFEA
jgi:phage-related protein